MLRVLKIHFNICFIEPWSGEPVEKSRERGKEREREKTRTNKEVMTVIMEQNKETKLLPGSPEPEGRPG